MVDMKAKLTNYAIGAIIGLVAYHYVLERELPNTFKPLNTMNNANGMGKMGEMNKIGGTGCNSCGQVR
jgi:hypothetical protein